MPPPQTTTELNKTNQEKLKSAKVIAVSLLNDSRAEIATETGEKFNVRIADLKAVEEDKGKIFVFGDAVEGLAKLQQRNCEPKGVIFDVKLSDSLLTAGLKLSDSYTAITERYLGEAKRKIDPLDLLSLRETLRQHLKQENLVNVAQIEFEATKATARMQNNGLRLDVALLKQKQQALQEVKTATASEIQSWLSQRLPDETRAIASVDWASNGRKHKSEILRLFKKAGVPLENSLSKDVLKGLSKEHPILEKLVEHRSAHHRMGKGGIGGLLDKADSQGKVYPTWNQNVAATGRMSATKPAAQNIPHDLAEAVVPSKEGYVFVKADYSQIELRVLAEIAGDTKLIEAFKQGKDPHRLTASLMTGKPEGDISDAERKAAKPVNFGRVYGQTAQGLVQYAQSSYGVTFTLEEAEKYQQAITEGYPKIGEREKQVKAEFSQQWQQSIKRVSTQPSWQGKESPQTRTVAGRRRLWQALERKDPPVTEALNAAIQGTSADITKAALASLPELLEGTKASLVAARHDEIVLEVPLEEAKLVSEILNQTMVKAGERFLKEVPVVCDVEICQNMAGLELTSEQHEIVLGGHREKQKPEITMESKVKPRKRDNDFDIRAYVEILSSNDTHDRAPCPCCVQEGKEPDNLNLSINKETGYFNCFRGEDKHGYGEIREALGLPRSGLIPEHLRKTAPKVTVKSKPSAPVVKTVSRSQVEQSQQRLQKHPTALAYLESRGITPEMAQRYNLGLDSSFKGKNGMERPEAITIFYQDATNPQTYYRKKRYAPWFAKENLPKGTPKWSQYGVPASVWVTHNPPGAEQTYITEGAWDAIRLSEELRKSGEKIAVACCTTGATGVPPSEQLAAIPTDKVTIFYDLDQAGSDGASKMAEALSEVGKKGAIATVPYEGKIKEGYDLSDAIDAGYSLRDIHTASNNSNQLTVGDKVKVAYVPPSVQNLETGIEVTVTSTPYLRANQEVVGFETSDGQTFLLPTENLEKTALTSEQIENKAKELAALNYLFEQIPLVEKQDKTLAANLNQFYQEKRKLVENYDLKVVRESQEMLSELETDKLDIKAVNRALERLNAESQLKENVKKLENGKMKNKGDLVREKLGLNPEAEIHEFAMFATQTAINREMTSQQITKEFLKEMVEEWNKNPQPVLVSDPNNKEGFVVTKEDAEIVSIEKLDQYLNKKGYTLEEIEKLNHQQKFAIFSEKRRRTNTKIIPVVYGDLESYPEIDFKYLENVDLRDLDKQSKSEANQPQVSAKSSQKSAQTQPRKKLTSFISVKRIKNETTPSFNSQQVEEKAKALLEYGGLVNPLVVHRQDFQNFTVDPVSAFDLAVAQKARELDPKAGEMVNGWIIENEVEEKALKAQLALESPTINSEEKESQRLNYASKTSGKLAIPKHKNTQALVSVKRIKSGSNQQFEVDKVEKQARNLLEYGALVKPLILRRDGVQNYVVHPDSAFDLAVAQRAREMDPRAAEMVNAWILETPIQEKAYAVQRSVTPSYTQDLETEKWVEWDELVNKIDVEMERIGWSKEQGKEHLQKTYGVKSRQQLTDEQLFSFIGHLESQPSVESVTEVEPLPPPKDIEVKTSTTTPKPSRWRQLINTLEEQKKEDIEHSAKVFAATAQMSQTAQKAIEIAENSIDSSPPESKATQDEPSQDNSSSSNKPKLVTKKSQLLSTNQQQTTSTMISSEQVHETKKAAEDLQSVPHEVAVEGSKILKKILDRLKKSQKNKEKKNNLNIDLYSEKTPVEVQINLDKEQVFKGNPNDKNLDKLKGVSEKDLNYLSKALDLEVGKAPEGFNRNLTIKFNDQEVFKLQDGVVKVNELSQEKQQSRSKTKTKPKVQDKPKDTQVSSQENSSVIDSKEKEIQKNEPVSIPIEIESDNEPKKESKNKDSEQGPVSIPIEIESENKSEKESKNKNSEQGPVSIPIEIEPETSPQTQIESEKQSTDFLDKLKKWNKAFPIEIETESKPTVERQVDNKNSEQGSVSIPTVLGAENFSIEQTSQPNQENNNSSNQSVEKDESLEKSLSQLGVDPETLSQVIAQVKSRENQSSPVIVVVNNQPEQTKEKKAGIVLENKEKTPNLFEKAKQGLKKSLGNISQSIKQSLAKFKQQGKERIKNSQQRLKSIVSKPEQKDEGLRAVARRKEMPDKVQSDLNNVTALGATSRIMATFGQDNDKGGQVFEGNTFRFEKTNNDLKIIAKDGRGEILNFEKGKLSGNLNKADLKQLQKIDRELDKTTTMMRSSESISPKKEMAMER